MQFSLTMSKHALKQPLCIPCIFYPQNAKKKKIDLHSSFVITKMKCAVSNPHVCISVAFTTSTAKLQKQAIKVAIQKHH